MNKPIIQFLILFLCSYLFGQTPSKPESGKRILNEIRNHTSGMAIWWTGHNGWLIKSDTVLIGTDLALESSDRQYVSPISAAELAAELDISFISHEHGDHFERETSEILTQKGECIFVLPANCAAIAKEEVGIPGKRLRLAKPREPFNINGIKVEPVRAIHGNPRFAVFYDANLED